MLTHLPTTTTAHKYMMDAKCVLYMKDDEIKSPHYDNMDANSVTIDQNDKS